MNTEKTSTGKMRVYFKAQNIEFSAKRIFIDGLGGMAYGLFASLLIGTIISTVGTYLFDLRFTLWGNEYSLFADANGFDRPPRRDHPDWRSCRHAHRPAHRKDRHGYRQLYHVGD